MCFWKWNRPQGKLKTHIFNTITEQFQVNYSEIDYLYKGAISLKHIMGGEQNRIPMNSIIRVDTKASTVIYVDVECWSRCPLFDCTSLHHIVCIIADTFHVKLFFHTPIFKGNTPLCIPRLSLQFKYYIQWFCYRYWLTFFNKLDWPP